MVCHSSLRRFTSSVSSASCSCPALLLRAFALAAFPENVRHDAMRDQPDQEPLAATAEAGQKLIDAIVVEVARYIQGMIDGTNVASVPEFHP